MKLANLLLGVSNLILFVFLAVLYLNLDLAVVNNHRDVSTLNQRFSGITNIDERFEKQRKDQDAAFSQVLTVVRSEGQAAVEKVDERAKVLEGQVRAYDNRLRAAEAANADLRRQVEELRLKLESKQ